MTSLLRDAAFCGRRVFLVERINGGLEASVVLFAIDGVVLWALQDGRRGWGDAVLQR